MYFDDFTGNLKKKPLPFLILFFGDSEGGLAEGHKLFRQAFQKANQDGTIQTLDGAQHGMTYVVSTAQTSQLFATGQLIVIHHAEKILGGHSESAVKQLVEYFENPNPSSYLLFLASGMKKNSKAVTAVEKKGWAVQCSEMPDWKLTSWVLEKAKTLGIGLTEEGAQVLIQKVGPDMALLQNALEHLLIYLHPKKSASAEDVRNLPVPGIEADIFPFVDAMATRQGEKALKLLDRMPPNSDTGAVMMLYQRMRELLLVSIGRSNGWDQGTAAQQLGLHPFRIKNLWDQSAYYSVTELKKAMNDLIHLQAGTVTGRLGKGAVAVTLEGWILKWGKKKAAPARGAAIK